MRGTQAMAGRAFTSISVCSFPSATPFLILPFHVCTEKQPLYPYMYLPFLRDSQFSLLTSYPEEMFNVFIYSQSRRQFPWHTNIKRAGLCLPCSLSACFACHSCSSPGSSVLDQAFLQYANLGQRTQPCKIFPSHSERRGKPANPSPPYPPRQHP